MLNIFGAFHTTLAHAVVPIRIPLSPRVNTRFSMLRIATPIAKFPLGLYVAPMVLYDVFPLSEYLSL